jgi:hypothetical protein
MNSEERAAARVLLETETANIRKCVAGMLESLQFGVSRESPVDGSVLRGHGLDRRYIVCVCV